MFFIDPSQFTVPLMLAITTITIAISIAILIAMSKTKTKTITKTQARLNKYSVPKMTLLCCLVGIKTFLTFIPGTKFFFSHSTDLFLVSKQ